MMAQGKSLGEIKSQLDSSGLRVVEFCFLGGWQDARETRLKEVLYQTHHVCKVSRSLGCLIVVNRPGAGTGMAHGRL